MIYEKNEYVEEFNISVSTPDGSQVHIEHAARDTAKETLVVWTSPVGDSKAALETMQNKSDEWIAREKEGTLSRGHPNYPSFLTPYILLLEH